MDKEAVKVLALFKFREALNIILGWNWTDNVKKALQDRLTVIENQLREMHLIDAIAEMDAPRREALPSGSYDGLD